MIKDKVQPQMCPHKSKLTLLYVQTKQVLCHFAIGILACSRLSSLLNYAQIICYAQLLGIPAFWHSARLLARSALWTIAHIVLPSLVCL